MALTSKSRSAYAEIAFGQATDRATAALPATTTAAIFTIAGGGIWLFGLIGEVTTIIQAQATTLKVVMTPTTGTAGDLSATVDMNAKEVGALLGITGLPSDAMVALAAGAPMCTRVNALPVGQVRLTTGATSTGSVKWRMFWLPRDVGATVTAV